MSERPQSTAESGSPVDNQAARLEALRETGLLDSAPEANFDRFTSMVCRVLGVPISLISLVDRDRHFLKSQQGLPEPLASTRDTGLPLSFCKHVVLNDAPFIVPDARKHELVCNSLAIPDLGVEAYLGVPLRTADGHVLGSLCAIDSTPRAWTGDDVRLLADLAELVMTEIELRSQLQRRQHVERELRESNDRLEIAQQATGIGVFDYDPVHDRSYVTQSWLDIYGARGGAPFPNREEWLRFVHPEDRARVLKKANESIASGVAYRDEFRVIWPDGSVHWVETTSMRVRDDAGQHVRSIGTALDITERKEAEQRLALQQERLLLTHRATSIGTWESDLRTGERWWSDETFAVLGLQPSDPPPSHEAFLQLVHVEDREHVRSSALGMSAEQPNADVEFRIVRPNGEVRWVNLRARAIVENGEVVRLIGANLDVTERKSAEDAVRAGEERTRVLLESLPQMMWLLQPDGSVEFFNRSWYEYTGLDLLARDGLAWTSVIHPDDHSRLIASRTKAIEKGEEYDLEVRIRRASDGSYRWHAARVVPMFRDGRLYAWQGSAIDIHDRRTAEEVLVRTEKLAAVGRLASSIAHEINNPLEAVTNLLYLLDTSAHLAPEDRVYLKQAQQELARVSHIATETLRFHRQTTKAQPVHAAELIESVLTLHHGRLMNANIAVEKRLREAKPLLGDTAGIRQVLANLVGNAIDAMPRGGRLLVRKREATHWRTGHRGVRIIVADTGEGMSPQTQARLFEAFYTTKGSTGTGLGLWVSKGIVDKHGGTLAFRSLQCKGTVFNLFFPYEELVKSGAEGSAPVAVAR